MLCIDKNKKGMELVISTVILFILGVLVLTALITALIFYWDDFKQAVENYSGSDEQRATDLCNSQCSLDKRYDFCCANKTIGAKGVSCAYLNINCSSISCEGACG